MTGSLFAQRTDQRAERPADEVCHELLLRLAGRLPDELLWRLRDWLAAGSRAAVSAILPRELLRHRVGLTEPECAQLTAALGGWGASRRLLDAVLPIESPDEPAYRFVPPAGGTDLLALSLLAVVRGHPGCRELRLVHRIGAPAGRVGRAEQPLVLVRGGERPWLLTGTLQRLARAHGDRHPGVEVLPAHTEPTAYHRAALDSSTPLWSAPSAAAS